MYPCKCYLYCTIMFYGLDGFDCKLQLALMAACNASMYINVCAGFPSLLLDQRMLRLIFSNTLARSYNWVGKGVKTCVQAIKSKLVLSKTIYFIWII